MRLLSRIFLGLGGVAAVLSVVWFVYIQKLGCAMGSVQGSCPMAWPWELHAEDFLFMVAIPAAITLALFGLGVWLSKRAKRS